MAGNHVPPTSPFFGAVEDRPSTLRHGGVSRTRLASRAGAPRAARRVGARPPGRPSASRLRSRRGSSSRARSRRARGARGGSRRRTSPGRDASGGLSLPAGSTGRPPGPWPRRGSRRAARRARSGSCPSSVLRATLPVKPSQTTTSASPSSRARPSTFPSNRSPEASSSACASSVSWFPFSGSSPIESSRTEGSESRASPARRPCPCARTGRGARASHRRWRPRR